MSCRSGATRGCDPLQPLRATVPFQLHNETQRCRYDKTVDRIKCRPPKPTIRRTLSLDAIVGPYLQGQWPKETENPSVTCVNDKATQVSPRMSHHTPTSSEPSAVLTPGPVGRGRAAGIKKLTPNSWAEESRGRRSIGGHKRSASWSSTEHLREVAKLRHQLQKRSRHAAPSGGYERPHHPLPGGHVAGTTQTILLTPLSRLAPRLRRSVEGLNLELEGVFVTERPEEQHKILDVPDGHRAPVPAPRCSSGSQRDPSPAHLDPAFPSPSQSPGILEPSPLSLSRSPCCLNPALLSPSQSPCPMVESDPVECEAQCPPSTPPSPVALDTSLLKPYSWPRPNKTYTFQREPPEGCERVRVCEEMSPSHGGPFLQPSCPDPNKVNFTPHGGSAFCPVSLLKPLLPSMDILFRGLSVSPVTGCSGQSSVPYQATGHAVGGYLSGSFQE